MATVKSSLCRQMYAKPLSKSLNLKANQNKIKKSKHFLAWASERSQLFWWADSFTFPQNLRGWSTVKHAPPAFGAMFLHKTHRRDHIRGNGCTQGQCFDRSPWQRWIVDCIHWFNKYSKECTNTTEHSITSACGSKTERCREKGTLNIKLCSSGGYQYFWLIGRGQAVFWTVVFHCESHGKTAWISHPFEAPLHGWIFF